MVRYPGMHYSFRAKRMPGQRPGQSLDQRAAGMASELERDIRRSLRDGQGDWDRVKHFAQAEAKKAATIGEVVKVGLAVLAAGAGSQASGLLAVVVGRFSRLAGTISESSEKAIQATLLETLKRGIRVSGEHLLRYRSSTPEDGGEPNDPTAFLNQGLQIIDAEHNDMNDAELWLTTHRAALEGSAPRPGTSDHRQPCSCTAVGLSREELSHHRGADR